MTINIIPKVLFKLLIAAGVVVALTACGGGGGGSSGGPTPGSNNSSSQVVMSSSIASLSKSSVSSTATSVSSSTSSLDSSSSKSSSSSQTPDTTPDAFSFTAVTGAALGASVTSAVITVSGINTAAPISITNGQYSIAGGAFTSAAGTVTNSQSVTVKLATSATPNTVTQAVLSVGGVVGTFSVTTVLPDTTPDAFSFTAVTGAAPSSSVTSAAITVSGINTATPISITNGQYSIAGGAFTSAAGTVTNDQSVTVRLAASAALSTNTQAVLTIGGVAETFSVATVLVDTTPDAFNFTAIITGSLNTAITSNLVTVSGINTAAPISITNGQYSIAGGAFTSAAGTVSNGQAVVVKATSAAGINITTQAVLTIGSVVGAFSVTTALPDTTPDAFGFTAVITGSLNTAVTSNVVTISGVNTAVPISITNGEYSIAGGAFTSAVGMVTNGQTVTVKATSAANINTTTQAVLTVGGVASTFSIITMLQDTTPYLMGGAMQGRSLNIATVVSTLAGVSPGAEGIGAAVRFKHPKAMVRDGANLYVADTDNQTIRKIVIATGAVTTLAGSAGSSGSADGIGAAARFNYPQGITIDGPNLYVADSYNNTVRKIVIATGTVTTFAGAAQVSGSADGTGVAARFQRPDGITTDGTNLYVADFYNHTIRKIVMATGAVTTLAGAAGVSGSANGTGAAAKFNHPHGIITDGPNLYVTEYYNHSIRKIVIATGAVTLFAGSGSGWGHADGIGTAASFFSPYGITSDNTNLYVADADNHTIRKIIIATGVVTTLAGTAGAIGSADGIGVAASFNEPSGISTDGANLFVADADNNTIRKIAIASGVVNTIAGSANFDGVGTAASFFVPQGVTTDGTNLYEVDNDSSTIRKIVMATGAVTTLAGTAGSIGSADGLGAEALFYYPKGITTDGANLYVADNYNNTIRKIVIATGAVTTLAGRGGFSGSIDGTGTAARFFTPQDITTDNTNLYVVDTNNNTIRKIVIATGAVTTLAGTAGVAGSADGTAAAARFYHPSGITTDGVNLYVADTDNHTIRKIVMATGTVTTLTGSAEVSGSADGMGVAARFKYPSSITSDGANLYVVDASNNTIRKIVIAAGTVTTLVGTAGVSGYADGVGAVASFNQPWGITTNGFDLFVTDSTNNTIRKIH